MENDILAITSAAKSKFGTIKNSSSLTFSSINTLITFNKCNNNLGRP